jgi:hypothetical protein
MFAWRSSHILLPDIDGAYFGSTFAHLFFMTYPNLIPSTPPPVYIPRVFGYRIHRHSSQRKLKLEQEASAGEYQAEIQSLKHQIAALKSVVAQHESKAAPVAGIKVESAGRGD